MTGMALSLSLFSSPLTTTEFETKGIPLVSKAGGGSCRSNRAPAKKIFKCNSKNKWVPWTSGYGRRLMLQRFESRYCIQDGHFSYLFAVKIVIFV